MKKKHTDDFFNFEKKPKIEKLWSDMSADERRQFQEESKPAIKWFLNSTVENARLMTEHKKAHKEETERKRHDASERGKHPKRREAIYHAIRKYLKKRLNATNKQVLDSFPKGPDDGIDIDDEGRYSVYRDGEDIYQVDSGGKEDKTLSIGRRTFDKYVTDARDELKISTRRKQRTDKKN